MRPLESGLTSAVRSGWAGPWTGGAAGLRWPGSVWQAVSDPSPLPGIPAGRRNPPDMWREVGACQRVLPPPPPRSCGRGKLWRLSTLSGSGRPPPPAGAASCWAIFACGCARPPRAQRSGFLVGAKAAGRGAGKQVGWSDWSSGPPLALAQRPR